MSGSVEIAAVLFDADGVLQHQGGYLALLAAAQGWSVDEVEAFMNEVFDVERAYLTKEADLLPLLQPVLEAHDVTVSTEQFLIDWCRSGIAPNRAALDVVRRLRSSGVVCALATNQVSYRAAYMLDDLGYDAMFDHCFISCQLGCAKPNQAFFEAALRVLELDPPRVLFIDDHPPNIDAARNAGLSAQLFGEGDDLVAVLGTYGLHPE